MLLTFQHVTRNSRNSCLTISLTFEHSKKLKIYIFILPVLRGINIPNFHPGENFRATQINPQKLQTGIISSDQLYNWVGIQYILLAGITKHGKIMK